jgi:hypothetical protein
MKDKPPRAGLDGFTLNLPPEQQVAQLCERLQALHGLVRVSHEASGAHANFACPKCLDAYGARELSSRHLSFNLDKYFRTGAWTPKIGRPGPKGYAQCMKEHGNFSIADLLSYEPLDQRGYRNNARGPVVIDRSESTYLDVHGRTVPLPPGVCIPVDNLPYDHPCQEFLRERDLDPVMLSTQFGACFCDEGRLEQAGDYTWLPNKSWRNTSQGRLIVFSIMQGSKVAWQSRVIQRGDTYLHPYTGEYVTPPTKPVHYMTGKGGLRNRQLCGFDNALANILPGDDSPICVLTEGPLDAARFPRNGMAILGKYLSREQALMIRLYFKRALLAFDAGTDKAGADLHEQAMRQLHEVGVVARDFWKGSEYDRETAVEKGIGKIDCGMLTYEWCREQYGHTSTF